MHRVDDLDVKIFRELGSASSLQWNVRETYSGIARRIGVDEETVRRRIKKAEVLGSIICWKMMINPHLVGCEASGIDLEVDDESKKDRILHELRLFRGIVKILNFRGRELQITFYHSKDEFEERVRAIRSICSAPDEPIVWRMAFPQSLAKITVSDWKILLEMLDDARESLETVSKATGISVRTVTRRLTRLVDERGVYLQGVPNFQNFAGLSCVFLVVCPEVSKKKEVDQKILSSVSRIEIVNTNSKNVSTFVTMFENLSQVDEVITYLQSLDGVSTVKMGIMKELIAVQDWLKDEIEKRMALMSNEP